MISMELVSMILCFYIVFNHIFATPIRNLVSSNTNKIIYYNTQITKIQSLRRKCYKKATEKHPALLQGAFQ